MYGRTEWLKAISRHVRVPHEPRPDRTDQLEIDRLKNLQEILHGNSPYYISISSSRLSKRFKPTVIQTLFPTPGEQTVEYLMYDLDWQFVNGDYIPPFAEMYIRQLTQIGVTASQYEKNRQPRKPNIYTTLHEKPTIISIAEQTEYEFPLVGAVHFRNPVPGNIFNESLWVYFALSTIPPDMYPEFADYMQHLAMLPRPRTTLHEDGS